MMNNLIILDDRFILTDEGRMFYRDSGEEYFPPEGSQYPTYRRRINKIDRQYKVHRLVMEIFGPEKPGTEYEVDHVNQNKKDASLWNLRWVTHQQNMYNTSRNRPVGQRKCDISNRTEYQKIYKQHHEEEIKAYQAKYKSEHKEENKDYQKIYKQQHKEKLNAYHKIYKQQHKEKLNAYHANYMSAYRKAHKTSKHS